MQVKVFTFNPFGENTYVVSDESTSECMIIDPGCFNREEEVEIAEYIRIEKLKPVILFNSHCHIDHIMGNGFISSKYQLPLHLHKDEEQTMQHSAGWGKMYGLEIGIQPNERIYVDQNSTLKLGSYTFNLLFTPGHSVASLSMYCEQANTVFSGDVLFRLGIGRYDLPGGDLNILSQSIQNQLYTLPDHTKVYAGHGEPTTIGFEKLNNPFVKFR